MTDPVLHESFVLWPAWCELVQQVSTSDPRDADPQSVYGAAMAIDHDRMAALLYGEQIADTMAEAADLLDDVLLMAQSGVRPKFALEVGLGRIGETPAAPGPAPALESSHRRDYVVQALAGLGAGVAVALLMRGRRS